MASKIFNDSVHGHIEMPPLLVKIIDTPEFQRLRNIKQLGGGYYVFPGASHNRFEHSIGVAHLAGEMVKSLRAHQGLNITKQEELCVQIAGLCHDLGHGPLSHVFGAFMNKVKPELEWKHEEQSVKMLKMIIAKPHIEDSMKQEGLRKLHCELIEDLICPPIKIPKDKVYLYQIVANSRTGIDVDRMDYLIRDCHHLGMKCNFSHERYMKFARVCTDENGEKQICMRDKEAINMYEFFHIRTLLYHNAYHHRVAKAVELMIVDALEGADKTLKISDKVGDLQQYMTLTDDILHQIQSHTGPELVDPREIIKKISERKLYKFIGDKIIFEPVELKHLDDKKMKEMLKDWLENVDTTDINQSLNLKDFEVLRFNFRYGRKEENPVDALRFYRKGRTDKSIQLSKDQVSYFLPEKFAEIQFMLVYKGENKAVENLAKEHINKLWNDLDPVSAVVNNPSIYMDLTDKSNDILQKILHSSTRKPATVKEMTKRISKQGSDKFIAEKIFKSEKLEGLDCDGKLMAWLEKLQTLYGGQELHFTADDFKVVKHTLDEEPDFGKVILLYKGLPKEHLTKFWEEVLKDQKHPPLAIKGAVTAMDLTDDTPMEVIYLILAAAQEVTERLLNQGFFFIAEKTFRDAELKHLNSDKKWKEKLEAWLTTVQSTLQAANFKVISYQLPEKPGFTNFMIFHKGLRKEDTEKFWDEI